MTIESRAVARSVARALGLAGCLGTAQAQTIYRCGNEYTRIPCANGRPLESSDTRSAAQRAEARALMAQERRQAAEMEASRRRDQAALKPAAAASLGPVRSAAPAASAVPAAKKAVPKKHPRKAQDAEERDFVAGVPPTPKPKKAPTP